jgi:CSLREA domain-containing protein
MSSRVRVAVAAVTVLLSGVALPGIVRAASGATITVNTSSDEVSNDGNCSLREAVQAANSNAAVDHCHAGSGTDTIVFASSTDGHTINLTLGPIDASSSMTIKGNGATKTKVTGADFSTDGGSTSTIEDMTLVDVRNENATVKVIRVTATGAMSNISDGSETSTMKISHSKMTKQIENDSGFGTPFAKMTITKSRVGSIDNNSGSGTTRLTVTDSTAGGIHNNTGTGVTAATIKTSTLAGKGKGPGISLNGDGTTVTVFRSTIDHFTSGVSMDQGNVTITDSTISRNKSNSLRVSGGAVQAINDTFTSAGTGIAQSFSGTVTLTNTIVALDSSKDCKGHVESSGGNIADDSTCHLNGSHDRNNLDPQLGALQNNGGPTHTQVPKSGSPAIDHGLNGPCPSVDQRGIKRPQDGNGDKKAICDVGSVEVGKK